MKAGDKEKQEKRAFVAPPLFARSEKKTDGIFLVCEGERKMEADHRAAAASQLGCEWRHLIATEEHQSMIGEWNA